MKVLVTGATGFIGAHVVDQTLKCGHEVGVLARSVEKQKKTFAMLGIDDSLVQVHQGDVCEAQWDELLPAYEAVVHCAGIMSKNMADADKLWNLNVDGSDRLLRSAHQYGLDPIIHMSSFMAMFPPAGPIIKPDDPVQEPDSMYAKTKSAAERNARALQAEGAPVVCVYPASVNGPLDPTVGSGQEFFANGINEGQLLVTQGGLTFTDVRDLGLLVARLLEPNKGPRRILSTADYFTHQEILDLMSKESGKQLKAIRMPGWLMRLMGRVADLKQKMLGGPTPELTYETAQVLTRCVPQDDSEARRILGSDIRGGSTALKDMIAWMKKEGLIKS